MPNRWLSLPVARHLIHRCRQPHYVAAALLLLGAAARLRQFLAATSYWHDEAYLLLNVFPKSFLELVGPLSHDQAAPPLFLWILRVCYLVAGPSELAMRLPALLASLAALALMAPLARGVAGREGWLWAVACAAMSSALVYLSYQVKPYTTDVMVAEVVLAAVYGCLMPHITGGWRRAGQIGLLLAAFIGPWLSFPSVFVLAAACLALAGQAVADLRRGAGFVARRQSPETDWEGRPTATWRVAWPFLFVTVVSAVLVTSCTALWLVAARHHNTPYQQSFWETDFVDLSSLLAALAWLGRKLIEAGNYGVQGTGIPMALLAAIGLAVCARRQPWLAVALASPAAMACLAAALRHYPLGNRLLAFLLPCLWLLAAQGVAVVAGHLRRRAAWLAVLPVLIFLPAAVYTARYAICAKPSVEFRQAFAHIHRQMRDGDTLWVSQPEVYELYFGRPPSLYAQSPQTVIDEAARRGRIWMLCHPPAERNRLADDSRRRIESTGAHATERLEFVHLDVTVFEPPVDERLAYRRVQRPR
jgi:hypothetical protein